MPHPLVRPILGLALLAFGQTPLMAASLQAAPVLLEMRENAPSSAVTVRNTGTAPFDVQTRVFRWRQEGGRERLEETRDVVTSPPVTTLQPGATYSIRVVRVGRQRLASEEAYRVLVDQLPDQATQRSGTVALVMRHSIPVFLMPQNAATPNIAWSVGRRNGRLVLRAENKGDRRLRLAKMNVIFPDGRRVNFGEGLLGYALAGSTMEWVSPAAVSGASLNGARVSGESDLGPLNAQANAMQ
jgi:fimbrial chaperone protein